MSKPRAVKFASRVRLVSDAVGIVCRVHREEAERLYLNGQAVHEDPGDFVRELVLLDQQPGDGDGFTSSNSCCSVFEETLNGGSRLTIETATTLAREVTTQPCRAYKMKLIRRSLRPLYETIVREVAKG